MPVTAKLSRRFYEQLGDDLANELVEWFNAVDTTYRSDLRELNELNFARFDAKLEQRFAEQDARWERRNAERDAKWAKTIAQLEAKLDTTASELSAKLQRTVSDAKFDKTIADLDAKWERRLAEFRDTVNAVKVDLVRWMFAFWTGTMVALAAFVVAVLETR